MVETLLSSIAAKLAALGVVAKAGLGLSMAAASVGGAAAAGVPVAEDAVEAVTPIEFGGRGNDDVAEKIQQVGDEVTTEEDVLDDGIEEEVVEPAGPPAETHGATVSEAARDTDPGPGHGAIVSGVAKSKAGLRGPGESGGGSAPVNTPNGGTATADDASNGASSAGTVRASEARGGRAAAGAGNAESGVGQRP